MITIYSEQHYKHQPEGELYGGKLVPPFECPERVEYILKRIEEVALGEVIKPEAFDKSHFNKIHTEDFLTFLQTCWQEWTTEGFDSQILPTVWPARRQRLIPPNHIDGKVGYYALAAETAIVEGTWEAARSSAMCALTGAKILNEGNTSAFALCRPPGHHAAKDMYGGYCFLNNAAIAAQYMLDQDAKRIAILDPDFHHGNGTQDIFYDRSDVFYFSLHGDPKDAFPHFLGYADETGEGDGEGFNANYPMPPNTPFSVWGDAMADALKRIGEYAPNALIVSLGVDAFESDPISFFKLTSDDFTTYGGMIGKLNIPTLFVMEGGYAVEEVGINTVNVLQGFEGSIS